MRTEWLTRSTRRRLALVLLAMLACARISPASADAPADSRKEARTRFARGVELFEEGAFRAALIEFQRAYELLPDYRLHYNIGHAQMELQDYLQATQSYERYLSEGGSAVSPERQAEVKEILGALSARVGRLSILVTLDGAEVFIDEQRVGTSPLPSSVVVNVGRHRIHARTPRGATSEQIVDVAGADLLEVKLAPALPAALEAKPTPALVIERPDAPRGLSRRQKLAIASWAVAVPAAAASVATALSAGRKNDDLDAALEVKPATDVTKERAEGLRSSVRRLGVTSDVMTGVAAALAVTGVVLWVQGLREGKETPARSQRSRSVSWGLGPGTAHVLGQF